MIRRREDDCSVVIPMTNCMSNSLIHCTRCLLHIPFISSLRSPHVCEKCPLQADFMIKLWRMNGSPVTSTALAQWSEKSMPSLALPMMMHTAKRIAPRECDESFDEQWCCLERLDDGWKLARQPWLYAALLCPLKALPYLSSLIDLPELQAAMHHAV